LIQALTAPGDGIVVQTPVYCPFFEAVDNNGRRLILCSPHNPVGRVWTREELEHLSDICLDRGVLIISAEIHGDLPSR
jgi:cystathionine beta-lyase